MSLLQPRQLYAGLHIYLKIHKEEKKILKKDIKKNITLKKKKERETLHYWTGRSIGADPTQMSAMHHVVTCSLLSPSSGMRRRKTKVQPIESA